MPGIRVGTHCSRRQASGRVLALESGSQHAGHGPQSGAGKQGTARGAGYKDMFWVHGKGMGLVMAGQGVSLPVWWRDTAGYAVRSLLM